MKKMVFKAIIGFLVFSIAFSTSSFALIEDEKNEEGIEIKDNESEEQSNFEKLEINNIGQQEIDDTDEKTTNTEKNNQAIIEDGIYEIVSVVNQNKIINVENNNYNNLTNINLGTNKNLKRQKFYIVYDNSKQSYTIKSMNKNKVLDIDGGRISNSTNIQLYENNGTIAQQWEIREIENGEYAIFSKNSNKCIDIKWRCY